MSYIRSTINHHSRLFNYISQKYSYRTYAKVTPFHDANHIDADAGRRQLRMLFLGCPGSGKGTQSARIQRDFNVIAIASGDLLRKNIAAGTEIGKLASAKMANGELVSDDIMISLINTKLQNINRENWLLDGFPRNLQQALALDRSLEDSSRPLNLVINLAVPEEVILQRIIDRWVHIPSGRVYNLSYNPPLRPGLDDVTGEPLSKREDDNPEVFRRRLRQHHLLTEPLLDYYDQKGLLLEMHGRTSDEIYPQIQVALRDLFGLKVNPPPQNLMWEESSVAGGVV